MLYAFGFERIGVVVSDLYFVNPNPVRGREGAEQGVRLEIRLLERGELRGSKFSAQPIAVDRPIWRADLLESVDRPGTLDRAHHHPRFKGWEPERHQFVDAMSTDPLGWVGDRLADLDGMLEDSGLSDEFLAGPDAEQLRRAVPEILEAVGHLLDRVRAGELAQPPRPAVESARVGWL